MVSRHSRRKLKLSSRSAMEELNKSLLEAASRVDLERVRELLQSGAEASFIDDPEGVWGARSKKGPLHVALSGSA
ncbi:unnamed protein product [Effrenium voratum]|nr:unnamed protein product [Effrenium voratum]